MVGVVREERGNGMNKREIAALKEISTWPNGRYSACWTPKSNERLQSLGYVNIEGGTVRITMAGITALAELKD